MSNDLQIETDSLEEVLVKIERNINSIKEDYENIYDAYKTLDKSCWIGPEKDKMDDKYGTILENGKNNIFGDLNNHLQLLKDAAKLYKNVNDQIESAASGLES